MGPDGSKRRSLKQAWEAFSGQLQQEAPRSSSLLERLALGATIRVWWPGDSCYYTARILEVPDFSSHSARVRYDEDNEELWHDLSVETWEYVEFSSSSGAADAPEVVVPELEAEAPAVVVSEQICDPEVFTDLPLVGTSSGSSLSRHLFEQFDDLESTAGGVSSNLAGPVSSAEGEQESSVGKVPLYVRNLAPKWRDGSPSVFEPAPEGSKRSRR